MVDGKGSRSGGFKPRRRRGKNVTNGTADKSSTGHDKKVMHVPSKPGKNAEHVNKEAARNNRNSGRSETQDQTSSPSDPSMPSLSYKPHSSLLIQLTDETPTWHQCGRNASGRDDTIHTVSRSGRRGVRRNPPRLVSQYRSVAESIYNHELALFQRQEQSDGGGGSDSRWVESTMKRGTLKDRIAAMSVVVGSDPVHKLYALDMLLNLAGCTVGGGSSGDGGGGGGGGAATNARVNQMAAEALADLFSNVLLPKERKLVPLELRPLYVYSNNDDGGSGNTNAEGKKKGGGGGGSGATQKTLSPRILLLWHYETLLRDRYHAFLSDYLGRTLHSSSQLDLQKQFALKMASELLRDIPEGEAQLLELIVNKLGDPSRKVASVAGYQLRSCVLEVHPDMVLVVAREVQQLAHRPHLSPRALYNCVIFLNQLKLVRDDDDQDEERYAGEEEDAHGKENGTAGKNPNSSSSSLPASLINTYFRLFEVAVQKTNDAGSSKNSKSSSNGKSSAGCMKSRLLSALLTGVNRAHPYLPPNDDLMAKHIDALYKIVHTAPPGATTQALMLLFHLAVGSGPQSDKPSVNNNRRDNTDEEANERRQDRFYRALYSTLSTPAILSSGKRHLTLYFNLLYKAMKYDTNPGRVVSFAKRLLCTALHCDSSILAGSLFLIGEVGKFRDELRDSYEVAAEGEGLRWDSSRREPKVAFTTESSGDAASGAGEEEKRVSASGGVADESSSSPPGEVDTTGTLWETSLLSQHYHPTVSKFVSSLSSISYRGDPLRDFALLPFLNKFAYKNPKRLEKIVEKLKSGKSGAKTGVGVRRSGVEGSIRELGSLPVNDPKFWSGKKKTNTRGEENENEDGENEFFRKFFVERAKRDEMNGVKRSAGGGGGIGADGNDEEEEDAEVDEALDKAEGAVVDLNKFNEEDWDTDPEEEEFANALAEKLMESAGNGKANFDNEDPDMEGWNDMYSDDEEGHGENDDDGGEDDDDADYSAMDGLDEGDVAKRLEDVEGDGDNEGDEFGLDDDDDDGSSEEGGAGGDVGDADAFMDAEASSDEDDGGVGLSDDDDDGAELAAALAMESDSDEGILSTDEEDDGGGSSNRKRKGQRSDRSKNNKKKAGHPSSSFVDASDYQDEIEKAWTSEQTKRKRRQSSSSSSDFRVLSKVGGGVANDDDDSADIIGRDPTTASQQKRRKSEGGNLKRKRRKGRKST